VSSLTLLPSGTPDGDLTMQGNTPMSSTHAAVMVEVVVTLRADSAGLTVGSDDLADADPNR
jgi:hypothetical protein